MKFDHIHHSSRFDRDPAVLERALDKEMAQADLITITEVSAKPRSDKLKEPGWAVAIGNHGGGDDAGIAWKKEKFECLFKTTIPLTNGQMRGNRSNIYAAVAVLKNQYGKVIVVAAVHLPASVEGKSGFIRNTAKSAVYMVAQRNLRKEAKKLKAKYNADAVLLVADWNINIKINWVQRWFRTNFPEYKVTWTPPYPRRGTHTSRIIDLSLIIGLYIVVPPVLRPKDPSSDHTAYKETLRFK